MSKVAISYSSLSNAAWEAKDVAKKLDKYADTINSDVYKKLSKYDGKWTSNISAASSAASRKISSLRTEEQKYRDYATDLTDLKDECKRVDKGVAQKVSKLTASFKKAHGISNNVVINKISNFFTTLGNLTAVDRWLDTQSDVIDRELDYLKESIEDWYDYEGGKELIKGVAIAGLEIAIGVITVVGAIAAIIAGGWTVALAAALIGGCIAVVNGVVNLINEGRAYSYADDDPATAKRKSDLNTIQDTLRVETDSEFWHGVATGIDIVNITCAIISIYTSGKELLQKGYKWATGSVDDISRIKIKDIFSKDFFSGLGTKFKEFTTSIKFGGWKFAKEFAINVGKDFVANFKAEYLTDIDINTVKSYLKIGKTLIKDGITVAAVFEFVIGPSLKIGDITTAKIDGAKITVNFDQIKVGDFYDIYDDLSSKVIGSDLFKEKTSIDSKVIDKLSESVDIKISIPEIIVPAIPPVVYV